MTKGKSMGKSMSMGTTKGLGKTSKPGGSSVGASIKGQGGPSATGLVPGGPGKSFAQKPIAGPTKPGMPISMKKALKRK